MCMAATQFTFEGLWFYQIFHINVCVCGGGGGGSIALQGFWLNSRDLDLSVWTAREVDGATVLLSGTCQQAPPPGIQGTIQAPSPMLYRFTRTWLSAENHNIIHPINCLFIQLVATFYNSKDERWNLLIVYIQGQ